MTKKNVETSTDRAKTNLFRAFQSRDFRPYPVSGNSLQRRVARRRNSLMAELQNSCKNREVGENA